MPQDQYLIVLCTFPTAEEARQIGTNLVRSQVAACVNLIPQVESIYQWNGATQSETEVLAVIKTTTNNYAAVEACIRQQHPYEVPEVIALPIERGSAGYLAWISENTRD